MSAHFDGTTNSAACIDPFQLMEQRPDEFPTLSQASNLWANMCAVLRLDEENDDADGDDNSNASFDRRPIAFPSECIVGLLEPTGEDDDDTDRRPSSVAAVVRPCRHLAAFTAKQSEYADKISRTATTEHARAALYSSHPTTDGSVKKFLSAAELYAFIGTEQRLNGGGGSMMGMMTMAGMSGASSLTDAVVEAMATGHIRCIGTTATHNNGGSANGCTDCAGGDGSAAVNSRSASHADLHGHCLECIKEFASNPPPLPEAKAPSSSFSSRNNKNKRNNKGNGNHNNTNAADFTHSDDDEDSRKKQRGQPLVAPYGYPAYCLDHRGVSKHWAQYRAKATRLLDIVDEEDYGGVGAADDEDASSTAANKDATNKKNKKKKGLRDGPSVCLVGDSDDEEDEAEEEAAGSGDDDGQGDAPSPLHPLEVAARMCQAHGLFSFTIGPAKGFVEVVYCADCGMFLLNGTAFGGDPSPPSASLQKEDEGANGIVEVGDMVSTLDTTPQLVMKLLLVAHIIKSLNNPSGKDKSTAATESRVADQQHEAASSDSASDDDMSSDAVDTMAARAAVRNPYSAAADAYADEVLAAEENVNAKFLVPMARGRDGQLIIIGNGDEATGAGALGKGLNLQQHCDYDEENDTCDSHSHHEQQHNHHLAYDNAALLNQHPFVMSRMADVMDPNAWRRRLFLYKPSLFHATAYETAAHPLKKMKRLQQGNGDEDAASDASTEYDDVEAGLDDGNDADQPDALFDLLNDLFEDGVVETVAGAAVQGWLGVVAHSERLDADGDGGVVATDSPRNEGNQGGGLTTTALEAGAAAEDAVCADEAYAASDVSSDGAAAGEGSSNNNSFASCVSTLNSSHAGDRAVVSRRLSTWFRYRFHPIFAAPEASGGHGSKKKAAATNESDGKASAADGTVSSSASPQNKKAKAHRTMADLMNGDVTSSSDDDDNDDQTLNGTNNNGIVKGRYLDPLDNLKSVSMMATRSSLLLGADSPNMNTNKTAKNAFERDLNIHDMHAVYGYVIEFESEEALRSRVAWLGEQLSRLCANGGKRLGLGEMEERFIETGVDVDNDGENGDDGTSSSYYTGEQPYNPLDKQQLFAVHHSPFTVPSLLSDLVPGVAYLTREDAGMAEDEVYDAEEEEDPATAANKAMARLLGMMGRTSYTHGRDVYCPTMASGAEGEGAGGENDQSSTAAADAFAPILQADGRDPLTGKKYIYPPSAQVKADRNAPLPIKCFVLSGHACGVCCHDNTLSKMLGRFRKIKKIHEGKQKAATMMSPASGGSGGFVGIGSADPSPTAHRSPPHHNGNNDHHLYSKTELISQQQTSMLVSTNLPRHVSSSQQEDHLLDGLALRQVYDVEMVDAADIVVRPPLPPAPAAANRKKVNEISDPKKLHKRKKEKKSSKYGKHGVANQLSDDAEQQSASSMPVISAGCPLTDTADTVLWLNRFLTIGRVMYTAMAAADGK